MTGEQSLLVILTFVASPAAPHGVAVAADESLRQTGDALSVDAFGRRSGRFSAHPVQVGTSGVSAFRLAVGSHF